MDDELLAAEAAAQRRAADQRVLDSGRAFEAEEVLTVGDRERAYLLHSFPLRGADGSVYGVCGIGTDITERREREDTLRAKLEWSLRIRRAIDEDRLVLYAQPIVEIASGRQVQQELLVRMRGRGRASSSCPASSCRRPSASTSLPLIDRWVIARPPCWPAKGASR